MVGLLGRAGSTFFTGRFHGQGYTTDSSQGTFAGFSLYDGYTKVYKIGGGGGGGGGTVQGAGGPDPTAGILSAFDQNAADFYGKPIPLSYGKRGLQGRHIWASNIRYRGSKAWVDFAVAFGQRGVPDAELVRVDALRVWSNDRLIVDKSTETGLPADASINFTIYGGSATQSIDPLISAALGATTAPAFRDMIYMVFRNFPLHKYGFAQIPYIRAELIDVLTSTNTVKEFSRFAATPANYEPDGAMVDWKRQRLITIDNTGGWFVNVWDISTNAQLTRAPLAITPVNITTSERVGYDDFFGNIFYNTGATNQRPIYVVDPLSGQTIASWGLGGSGLVNTPTAFVSSEFYATVQVEAQGTTEQFLVVGSQLDDFGVLRYDPSAGSLEYGHTGFVSDTNGTGLCRGEEVTSLSDPVAIAYGSDQLAVYRMAIPAGTGNVDLSGELTVDPPTYSKIYELAAGNLILRILCDREYGEILIFYRDASNFEHLARISPTAKFTSANPVATATLLFDVILAVNAVDNRALLYADISGGSLAFRTGIGVSDTIIVSTTTGDQSTYGGEAWRFTGATVDEVSSLRIEENAFWNSAGGYFLAVSPVANAQFTWSKLFVARASSENIPLSDMLRWVALSSGIEAADLSITGVDDTVIGGIIEQRVAAWDVFVSIGLLYDFEVFESEAKLKIVRAPKNAAFVADWAVPETDLTFINGEPADDREASAWISNRVGEGRMPGAMELVYINPSTDYSVQQAHAKRTLFPFSAAISEEIITITVPIIMTPSEAVSRLTEALFKIWHSQINFEYRLGPKYLQAEPGDVMAITVGNTLHYVQVKETTVYAEHSTIFTGERFATEGDVVITADEPLQDPNGIKSEATELWLIDIPLLKAADQADVGFTLYMAATSVGQGNWVGGTVYGSVDGMVFQTTEPNNDEPDFAGISLSALGTWGLSEAIDWKNSITVSRFAGVIANIATQTHAALVADQTLQLAAIGAPGRWEIVQIGTVVDNADGTVTLSNFVRGKRGTELNMGNHVAGDRIITLNRPPVQAALVSKGLLTENIIFKAAPLTAVTLSDIPGVNHTVVGNSHKPFAPVAHSAALSGSDIDLAWVRRTRLYDGTVLTDGDNTPALGEATELYEIDIYDAAGTTIVRTTTGLTTPAFTYTAAMITADGFGATPTTLKFDAYQVNADVGRGFVGSRLVDVL